jgi:peptidoglycan/xylan/chitin deacetylase (PgdA/CDA1 family)
VQYIFLSHDVDWSLHGPSKGHIMARRDRFDQETLRKVDIQNPYHNINDYVTIEDKFGIRSTFFFRTTYEAGKLADYESDIQTLSEGGWEIGLHCNPSSIENLQGMYEEKKELESLMKGVVKANRSHYLAYSDRLPTILNKLGFIYDSSLRKSMDKIDYTAMGYLLQDEIIEFPVTLMDAYLFTHMHVTEDKILKVFRYALDCGRKYNNFFNVITVIWHANVLKMKGGRKYQDILEYLLSQEDVKIAKGVQLADIITSNQRVDTVKIPPL